MGAVVVGAVLATAGLAGCGQAPPQPWSSELVSVNAAGTGSGNSLSHLEKLSADGKTVVFQSNASDLVAGTSDTNFVYDVFVRDLDSGTTTLVSVNAAGTATSNRSSFAAEISADGTKVAFYSYSSDLGPADAGNDVDLYVRDLVAGTTSLVSVDAAGTDGANGWVVGAGFDAAGTKIVFETIANNLGPTDSNGDPDVYLRDMAAGTTTLLSMNAAGSDSGNDRSGVGPISPDGTKVVFESLATDLVTAPETNTTTDVFVRDLTSDTTTLVSATPSGTTGTGDSPVISPDGSRVAFVSAGDDLAPGSGPARDIFLRDLGTATTSLVTVGAEGAPSDGQSSSPAFSPDGSKVAFHSWATNLGAVDTNNSTDVYLRDLVAGTTVLVSAHNGTDRSSQVGGDAAGASFSADGTRIAFTSKSGFLGANDSTRAGSTISGDESDVYVRDIVARTTTLVSVNATRLDSGNLYSTTGQITPDGHQVVFESLATNFGPVDNNGPHSTDIYIATLDGTS